MHMFEGCPLAFKYNYIDKVEQRSNPFMELGVEVHDFIDSFFDVIDTKEKKIQNLSKLKFHPNMDYKKNVAKLEVERFNEVVSKGFDVTYFAPYIKEKKYVLDNLKIIGIVDRVHRCHTGDVFAPRHSEFKDGDLVIVENKTGKPNLKKCRDYEEDLIWYKIILEANNPDLAPIKWGAVYFPYDNYIHHTKLKAEDCRALAKRIKEVREKIKKCVESNSFPATNNKSVCNWCSFRDKCEKW